jgi:glutaconate CoA-transferase subunit A
MKPLLKRKAVLIDEADLVRWIRSGMTIAIGGFINSSHPMTIIRWIIRNKISDLTIVGSGSAGLEVDLLIGAGCVKKIISPYLGAEALCSIGPFYRMKAEEGTLEVWECEEGQYYTGLTAAAQMLPFLPWRIGPGTSYPQINPDLKLFQDPLKGETLIAVPPIKPDLAIIFAAHSDPYGNVQHIGTSFSDIALVRAADETIVQVEKIIPNEEVRKNPIQTTINGAAAVLRAPYGAHPYASPGFYLEDRKHIREYVEAATAYVKKGDKSLFEDYIEKYILGPQTHGDYLEKIGIKRLISLYEY